MLANKCIFFVILGIEEEDKATQNFSNINKEYLYLMSSSGNTDQDKSTRHLQKSTTTSGHSKETRKLSTVEERSLSSPSLPVQSVTSSLTATPGKIDNYLKFEKNLQNDSHRQHRPDRHLKTYSVDMMWNCGIGFIKNLKQNVLLNLAVLLPSYATNQI